VGAKRWATAGEAARVVSIWMKAGAWDAWYATEARSAA
jgi:hypothetical protein